MFYGKTLTVCLATVLVVGCAVTNPSPTSTSSAPDAPPNMLSSDGSNVGMALSSASSDSGVATTASITAGGNGAVPSVPTAQQANASLAGGGLSVNMGYQETLSKTGKALPSAGYPVMEKDESAGTFYVLDKVGSGGKIERDTPIYQVRVLNSSGSPTQIKLLNSNGQAVSPAVSNRILGALKNKLS